MAVLHYCRFSEGFEDQVLLLAFLKIARNGRIIECLRLTPKSASGGLLKHSTVIAVAPANIKESRWPKTELLR
jgi:hypothetical protein